MNKLNLCPRKSVGAIIKDGRGRYLCLYRKGKGKNDPTKGLAFVAGHLDFIDIQKSVLEDPNVALIREVREEAGLKVEIISLVLHQTYPNPCGKGFNGHEWWVFNVTKYLGAPRLMEDKHSFIKFMALDEIKDYIERSDCDPAWSEYIWPELGII